jgi:predicted dehydrogenase
MTLRIAIVGCGKIADSHVEEIRRFSGRAELVAVSDLEPLLAEQLAVRYDIPAWLTDTTEMMERHRPDVVHITTPPGSHLELAKLCIQGGAHVYIEKPFALDSSQISEIIGLARSSRKVATVGYALYFDPVAERMRALLDSGAIGRVIHVESYFGYELSSSYGDAMLDDPSHWVHRLPGKLFQNVLDHALCRVAEFVTDARPDIFASSRRMRSTAFGDHRDLVDDELRVLMQGDAVSAYVTFSAGARPAQQFLRVYGTLKTIHVDFVTRTIRVEREPSLPTAVGRVVEGFQGAARQLRQAGGNLVRLARSEFQFFAGMHELLDRFYTAVEQDGDPPYAYADIERVGLWMDEIIRQVARP